MSREYYSLWLYIISGQSFCGQAIDHAGVRFGGGIDLGKQNESALIALGASSQTMDTLRPFIGLTGDTAAEEICNAPFELDYNVVYDLTISLINKKMNELRIYDVLYISSLI